MGACQRALGRRQPFSGGRLPDPPGRSLTGSAFFFRPPPVRRPRGFSLRFNPVSAGSAEHCAALAGFTFMFTTHSIDDIHYYQERVEACRKAAEQAADPSARIAHLKLARHYETRLTSAMESAAFTATAAA
jgi:hypothetical protein